MPAPRLTAATSVLVIVDIQDKLLAKIPGAAGLVTNTAFLLDASALVEVPVRATEQYPKGLGPTTPEIAKRFTKPVMEKTAFSCCGAAGFLDDLKKLNRPNIVLAGMEAHVCVLQTALDLLDAKLTVFLPVDALASRGDLDKAIALQRLGRAGAILTTSEAVGFEWLADSAQPRFKAFSKLVQSRSDS